LESFLDTWDVEMRAAMWLVTGVMAVATMAAAQSEPIAVVVRVTGAVQVQTGASRPARATPGLRLRAGDRLTVPAGAHAVILYRTGRSQTVRQSIRVQAPRAAAGGGVFQQTLRTLNEVAATDARALPNRQGMIRPIAGSPVPISPRNQLLVAETRPRFTWTHVPEATAYMLQVRDVAGGAPRRYPVGADTSFALAADAPELERGHTYEWSVARVDGGRAAPPQQFRVASQAELDAVQGQLDRLRRAGLDPEGDGAFLAAVVYREAGFLSESLAALDRVAASGGGEGADYHRLRGEIYAQLGLLTRATEELDAADGEQP
jgi:hypothetical protein